MTLKCLLEAKWTVANDFVIQKFGYKIRPATKPENLELVFPFRKGVHDVRRVIGSHYYMRWLFLKDEKHYSKKYLQNTLRSKYVLQIFIRSPHLKLEALLFLQKFTLITPWGKKGRSTNSHKFVSTHRMAVGFPKGYSRQNVTLPTEKLKILKIQNYLKNALKSYWWVLSNFIIQKFSHL